jgi:hypothetical protein
MGYAFIQMSTVCGSVLVMLKWRESKKPSRQVFATVMAAVGVVNLAMITLTILLIESRQWMGETHYTTTELTHHHGIFLIY